MDLLIKQSDHFSSANRVYEQESYGMVEIWLIMSVDLIIEVNFSINEVLCN